MKITVLNVCEYVWVKLGSLRYEAVLLPTLSHVPSVNVGWLLLSKFSFTVNCVFLLKTIIKLLQTAVCIFCILFIQFLYMKCIKQVEVVSPPNVAYNRRLEISAPKLHSCFFPSFCFSCDNVRGKSSKRNRAKLVSSIFFAPLCNSM